jgi:hypothetical protein
MRILFIAALLTLLPALQAQKDHSADSLQVLLKKSTIDSNKIKYQIALGEYYLFANPKESEKWFLKSNHHYPQVKRSS